MIGDDGGENGEVKEEEGKESFGMRHREFVIVNGSIGWRLN